MAQYLRRNHPAKKAELLRWRKQELIVKIRKGMEVEGVSTSAERVRDAKLAYLKGQRYYLFDNPQQPLDVGALEKIEAEMKDWQTKSVEEIIAWCSGRAR